MTIYLSTLASIQYTVKGKEICAGFAFPPQTAKVMPRMCDGYLVKMEKASYVCMYSRCI